MSRTRRAAERLGKVGTAGKELKDAINTMHADFKQLQPEETSPSAPLTLSQKVIQAHEAGNSLYTTTDEVIHAYAEALLALQRLAASHTILEADVETLASLTHIADSSLYLFNNATMDIEAP